MPESIIKRYYDELGKGNLIARKCNRCQGYTFPPTTACEHCGSTDLEWVTLSGKGKLLYASHGIDPPPNPRYTEMAPYVYGHIILEEGIPVQAIITGVKPEPEVLQQIFERGPVDVVPDILNVKGLNILAFKFAG
jgi:uncharacterized OB-fold protein